MTFSLARLQEVLAAAVPDRELLVWRDRRFTWGAYHDRCRRLANLLLARGLGTVKPRAECAPWESGQDHVALYLYNGNEYLEGMSGAFLARTIPVNVNYRYVADELEYLLRDSGAKAIVYHARFAATIAEVRDRLPDLQVFLQVDDGSATPLLDGAEEYEAALAAAPNHRPRDDYSADDGYILYTGGTTGMPKGVLWRHEDIFFAALGGHPPGGGEPVGSLEEVVERATNSNGMPRVLTAPPFMHGAAHWVAYLVMHGGGTVIVSSQVEALDPDDVWSTVEREQVMSVLIVGDAFAAPLLAQLEAKAYDLSCLIGLANSGAVLSPHNKQAFHEKLPHMMILDALGSSETGAQATLATTAGDAEQSTFQLRPTSIVLRDDLSGELPRDSEDIGWLAQTGWLPLGYLNDPEKTQQTFVTINGTRYAVTGDHVRYAPDGMLQLFGRGSVCINSGGEKIYVEEVESVLRSHPAVADAVVVGMPHDRWGQQVTAVVQPVPGAVPTLDDLRSHAAAHLAPYKLPKVLVLVDQMVRSPSGKADYKWAAARARDALRASAPSAT